MDDIIRRIWAETVISPDRWIVEAAGSRPQRGEAAGSWVRHELDGTRAYMKPKQHNAQHCRAANEKLASDLAFQIGANVPPVVLYVRPDQVGGDERFVCISMTPAGACFGFADIPKPWTPPVETRIAEAVAELGAEIALDAWLDNRDRNNEGNILWAPDETPRIFFIDFANSTGYGNCWENNQFQQFHRLTLPCGLQRFLIRGKVDAAVDRILALQPDVIRGIVNRLPDDFMPPAMRAATADRLMWRKEHLRHNQAQWYPS